MSKREHYTSMDHGGVGQVGCENPDGTLNIHSESETCDVCKDSLTSNPVIKELREDDRVSMQHTACVEERAAREIERLEHEVQELEKDSRSLVEDRQRAEIERLRAALQEISEKAVIGQYDGWCKKLADGALSGESTSAHETTANRCAHGFSAVGCAQCDRDAAKWRALRNCARITSMGSAGLLPEDTESDYAHLTLNFWTGVPAESPGPTWARDWLDKFVAKALRASPSEKAPERHRQAYTQHATGRIEMLNKCQDCPIPWSDHK